MIKKNVIMSLVVALFIACAQDSFCGDFQLHNLPMVGMKQASQQDVDALSQKVDQLKETIAQLSSSSMLKSCLLWAGKYLVIACGVTGGCYLTSRYLFGWANRNDAAHVQSEVDAADSAVNQLDINSDNLFKIIKGERLGLTRKLHTLESERLDGCSVEVKEAICGVRKNFQELQREAEGLQADLSDLSESDRKKAEQQIKELFSKQFIRLGVFENTALRGIWQQRTQLEALRGAAQDNNSHMNQLWKRIEHQRLPQQSSPFPALTYKQ